MALKPYDIPPAVPPSERFTPRMFTCYYEADIEVFKMECKKLGAIFEGCIKIDFLNIWNRPVGFGQYACIYQYKEDIEIEVRC